MKFTFIFFDDLIPPLSDLVYMTPRFT